MSTFPTFQFAVNRHGRNKDWEFNTLSSRFEDQTGTLLDVINHVSQGHALCAGLLNGGRRTKLNFAGSHWVLSEIDNSALLRDEKGEVVKGPDGKGIKVYDHQLTLEEAAAHPFIQKHCCLIYTTPSHTKEWHRFRLVWMLPESINNIDQYEVMVRLLLEQLPHDPSCKDATRVFYGNTEAQFPLINPNACLPAEWRQLAAERAEQERITRAERERLLALKREQFQRMAFQEGWDTDQLIEQALSLIPPRTLGSGNYDQCRQVLMALVDFYGPIKAEAIAEAWSPSIPNSTWDIPKKIKSFRRDGIKIGTLFHIAKQYGFKFPDRQEQQWGEPASRDYDAYIEQRQDQERAEAAEESSNLLEQVKQKFNRAAYKFLKRFGRLPRSPQEKPKQQEGRKTLRYGIDPIPERATWDGPAPHILYQPNERAAVWEELANKGWQFIQDSSVPGVGKSHTSGGLRPEPLGLEKLWLFSEDHRNPSTLAAETWTDLPVRHDGLFLDKTRKTQSGKFHLRRAREDEEPNTIGNCARSDMFNILASKGVSDAQEKTEVVSTDSGKSAALNPICATCRFVGDCASDSGDGFGFRSERRDAFASSRIRAHIDSAPDPGEGLNSNMGAIVDEASKHIKPTINLQAWEDDWVKVWAHLELELPMVHEQLKVLRQELYPLLSGNVQAPRYGWEHPQLLERMGPPPKNLANIIAAVQAITPTARDLIQPRDRVPTASCFTQAQRRRMKRIEDILKSYEALKLQYEQLERRYGFVDAAYQRKQLSAEERKIYQQWRKHFTDNRVRDLKDELKELVQIQQEVAREREAAKHAQRMMASQQAQEEWKRIQSLPVQWLLPLLRIWNGEPGTLRIGQGALNITLLNQRVREILHAFKWVLLLDATASPKQFGYMLGINPDEIVTCAQEVEPLKNLTIYQIRDVGLLGKQRSDELKERVAILKQTLIAKHSNLAIFDWINADEKDGWWFNHTRGTNEFDQRGAIASFGVPYMNLGVLQDNFFALTGQWGGQGFTDYVKELTDAEIKQSIGRLRARRRLSEQLTYYFFGDYDLPEELGAIELKSRDIHPDAAPASERSWQLIQDATRSLMKEGQKVTQQAISKATGLSQSWVSDICKKFVGGWREFRKIIGSLLSTYISDSDNFDEADHWVVNEYIPAIAEDPPDQIPAQLSGIVSSLGWDHWKRLAGSLSYGTKVKLLSKLLSLLPHQWLEATFAELHPLEGPGHWIMEPPPQ